MNNLLKLSPAQGRGEHSLMIYTVATWGKEGGGGFEPCRGWHKNIINVNGERRRLRCRAHFSCERRKTKDSWPGWGSWKRVRCSYSKAGRQSVVVAKGIASTRSFGLCKTGVRSINVVIIESFIFYIENLASIIYHLKICITKNTFNLFV